MWLEEYAREQITLEEQHIAEVDEVLEEPEDREDRAQYDKYFEIMDTFGIPGTKGYRDHTLRKKDAKTAVFPETLPYARPVGFAGPPGRKATEALSKYILVDMFAKSIQGMKPEDAVAWATGEMKKIYVG